MPTYTVQTGDTLGAIAKRFNVPISAVSGFRSNDPNTIFPGEVLSINAPVTPIPQSPQGQIVDGALQPSPTSGQAPTAQPPTGQPPDPFSLAGAQQISQTAGQGIVPQAPQAPTAQVPAPKAQTTTPPQTPQPQAPQPVVDPSGATVSAPEQPNVLESFGISPQVVESGFQTNPFGTLSDLVRQVTDSLGLPDVRENITNISNEIESLANERDDEIRKIQDNPWKSSGSKSELIRKIEDRYEQKIGNRTNRLTLMQNAYQDARQQAQFAATTAINLYDRQRTFDYNAVQDTLDRTEKQAEAERKAGTLEYSIQDVGGRTVRFGFDKEGNVVSRKDLGAAKAEPGGGVSFAALTQEQQSDPFIKKLLASAGGKPLTDTPIQQLNKGLSVLGQLGVLQTSVKDTKTGPLLGLFRGTNPWDTNAQSIKAQLNAIVPNLARGIYGEVGVLTDNDIKQYSKTLPTLTSTEDLRNAVLGITVDLIGKSIRRTLEVNAAAGRDVSGFVDIYTEMQSTRDSIFSQIPGYKGVGTVSLRSLGITEDDEAIFDSVVQTSGETATGGFFKDLLRGLGF